MALAPGRGAPGHPHRPRRRDARATDPDAAARRRRRRADAPGPPIAADLATSPIGARRRPTHGPVAGGRDRTVPAAPPAVAGPRPASRHAGCRGRSRRARHPARVQPRRPPRPARRVDAEADEATRVIPVERPGPRLAARHPGGVARRDPADASAPERAGRPDESTTTTTTSRAHGRRRRGGAGAAVAGALGSVGERVGSLARRAVDKVSELSPDTAPRTDRAASRRPLPWCRPSRSPRTSRSWPWASSSRFVVLALVIGVWGVSRIGSEQRLDLR